MRHLFAELRISLVATAFLAVILCGAYPMTVWCLARAIFPGRADGSLIAHDGEIAGSRLIGRQFTDPKYFHPRPSAAGSGYDAVHSGGSNLGPLSKELSATIAQRTAAYRAENELAPDALVPGDAVNASASGLDPHISVRNALIQAHRVAKARGLAEKAILEQVTEHTQGRDLKIFGEPRVNVLMLNRELDVTPSSLKSQAAQTESGPNARGAGSRD
ncbi:MAG: K(+)-transporting ATPase subunit C [Candidatus Krumholzibacteria bacterium]|nr:K(+)-transporting ATPase subunit C [Candidatus Krumholzibacteria bacterium]